MADSPVVQRLLALAKEGKLGSGEELLSLTTSVERSEEVVDLGRLDWSPNSNWVQDNGGLPRYIEEVAIGIMKSGKTRERAIPIAISRIKRWAAGLDGVKADTVARATVALAQWEALKAKAKAARLKKK